MSVNQGRLTGDAVDTYLEAREILATIGPDLNADQHWADLGRALGLVCRICDDPTRANRLCETHYRRHLRATRTGAALINRDARTERTQP